MAQNRLGTAQSQATSGSDCWGQSCGYDANNWNNLVSITVTKCTAPSLSVSVNTSNRITNSGFTYNASGDMTADGIGGLSFTWNAEERLTAAGGVTYTYDGDGWRVKKSNGIIHWRSLSGEILAETDLSGNNLREYIYFAGRRVARRDNNGTISYFLQDHLGSTRVITSSSGSIVRDSDYYPHGTEKLVSGTVDDPHKFAGMYFDSESGLYYTWFRMYSPSLGRWLAPDPIAGDVANPGSLNRYAYVLNNPTNLIDPLGLIWGPPWEPPTPPAGPPGPDPFGPPSPNPFGNGEGCTAPDGQCGGNPGSRGGSGKAPLNPGDQKKYDENKTKVYDEIMNPDCLTFLIRNGIDPTMVQIALLGQRAFNANKSTITMGDAGLLASLGPDAHPHALDVWGRVSVMSVAKYFDVNRSVYAIAQLGGSDVYFRQGKVSKENVFHEALHSAGYGDGYLKKAFGIEESSRSGEINKRLKENGCIK